jgi:hypothetical protein
MERVTNLENAREKALKKLARHWLAHDVAKTPRGRAAAAKRYEGTLAYIAVIEAELDTLTEGSK